MKDVIFVDLLFMSNFKFGDFDEAFYSLTVCVFTGAAVCHYHYYPPSEGLLRLCTKYSLTAYVSSLEPW